MDIGETGETQNLSNNDAPFNVGDEVVSLAEKRRIEETVDWQKLGSRMQHLLVIPEGERKKMNVREIMDYPDSIVQMLVVVAVQQLKSADVINRNTTAEVVVEKSSYLEKYRDLPVIFDENSRVREEDWTPKEVFGGRGSGENKILFLRVNPKKRVYVKEIVGKSFDVGRYDLGDTNEKAAIAGGKNSVTIEMEILKSDIPDVIKPLEISGNKVALPYIDQTEYGYVGLLASAMILKKGDTVIHLPLNAEQSVTAASRYLNLLDNLYKIGYVASCQVSGDMEIRMNPETLETVFYDFGICFPKTPLGGTPEEMQSLQRNIDRASYVELSNLLSNI